MAQFRGMPIWLQNAKNEAQRSDSWLQLSKDVFDIVASHMYDNGIRNFGSLTTREKTDLVAKAVNLLKDQSTYRELLGDVSTILDKQLTKGLPAQMDRRTRENAIYTECHTALESLLSNRPDSMVHLRQCLNSLMSPKLRYLLWQSYIANHTLEETYKHTVRNAPKDKLVSRFDYDISQKCNQLLMSDAGMQPLAVMNAAQSVMRHILSYFHAKSKAKTNLSEVQYLLAIPFVYCTLSNFMQPTVTTTNSLTVDALAKLAAQYDHFITSTYKHIVQPTEDLYKQVSRVVNNEEPELATSLTNIYFLESKPHEDVPHAWCNALFQPMIKTLFVGYLHLDTVMYIWDQIITCLDIPKCNPIPQLIASLLLLVQGDLVHAITWHQLRTIFLSKIKSITPGQLLSMVKDRGFAAQQTNAVDKESRTDSRAFFASNSNVIKSLPPWRAWYSDTLVDYFKSNKAITRVLKEGVLADDASLHSISNDSLDDLQSERNRLIEELHLMRQELQEARIATDKERQSKVDLQDAADGTIERLQLKLAAMHRTPVPTTPLTRRIALTTPQWEGSEVSSAPPSEPPQTPIEPSPRNIPSTVPSVHVDEVDDVGRDVEVDSPPKEDTPPPNADKAALDLMRDLVGRFSRGFNDLAHGSGTELAALNASTVSDLDNVRKAYENAKTQVFGRVTSDEELERMDPKKREAVTAKLSEATKTQLSKLQR